MTENQQAFVLAPQALVCDVPTPLEARQVVEDPPLLDPWEGHQLGDVSLLLEDQLQGPEAGGVAEAPEEPGGQGVG